MGPDGKGLMTQGTWSLRCLHHFPSSGISTAQEMHKLLACNTAFSDCPHPLRLQKTNTSHGEENCPFGGKKKSSGLLHRGEGFVRGDIRPSEASPSHLDNAVWATRASALLKKVPPRGEGSSC